MKLVSYLNGGNEQVGVLCNEEVFALPSLHPLLPATMGRFLENWNVFYSMTETAAQKLKLNPELERSGIPIKKIKLLAPLPHPGSLRDGYAFRQHVETARRNRGLSMTDAFDEFPVFYFGNHRTVTGPGEILCMPDHFEKLDYELEVAIVISKTGRNIRAENADEYIAGLMIMNDFSARTFQMEEMQLSLGPAKGKDFATATGPWLVTLDELKTFEVPCKGDHTGKSWSLKMSASLNNEKISEGNLADMDWTFAELIERASYGVDLYPGDIIGSGTVGTGCLLELNGTGKMMHPDYPEKWLQPGDEIKLSVEGLGELTNIIMKEETDFSILKKKKIKTTHYNPTTV
jgi:fumarylacetoacetate (FAA) hydrolase